MAKVNGGLFSLEASGALGKAIVYDRRGYVREWAIPFNPQSEGQRVVRGFMFALGKVSAYFKLQGGDNYVGAKAELGSTWPGKIAGCVIKNRDAIEIAAEALSSGEKTAYTAVATTIGIGDQNVGGVNIVYTYEYMYGYAYALYHLGCTGTLLAGAALEDYLQGS